MRIIAGLARGIPLKSPDQGARPTTDRVREALFSMIGGHLEGARVLDLFSGSGALGLEALSRGATEAVFVEQSRVSVGIIQENIAKTRLVGGKIHTMEALSSLPKLVAAGEKFDLIFADPPYAKRPDDVDWGAKLLQSPDLPKLLVPDGLFVLECLMTKRGAETIPGWEILRDRVYGSTRILILQKSSSTQHGEAPGAAPA